MRQLTFTKDHMNITFREKTGRDVIYEPSVQYPIAAHIEKDFENGDLIPQRVWATITRTSDVCLQTVAAQGFSFAIPSPLTARNDDLIAFYHAFMDAPRDEVEFILSSLSEFEKSGKLVRDDDPNAQPAAENLEAPLTSELVGGS